MNATVLPPSRGLIAMFALACGLLVANLYYAQPLIGRIGGSLGIGPASLGLLVTLSQIGYGAGLLVLVSLADRIENRRLALTALCGLSAALALTAAATGPAMFLCAAFATGFCAAAAQILVPFAAHLTPERQRGRTVGVVMGGLLFGIMLARPLASEVGSHFGWRAIFWASCVATLCLIVLLRLVLPRRWPEHDGLGFLPLLASLGGLLRQTGLLRRRTLYQSAMFAGFSSFWTAILLVLAAPPFSLTPSGIALFALAGTGGALIAPVAGRLADRGLTGIGTICSMATVAVCLMLSIVAVHHASLASLVVLAILLDAGVQTNQVLGLRAIYGLRPEIRGRLNALYLAIMFACGGVASMLSTILLHHGGWATVASASAAFVGIAMLAPKLRAGAG